MKIQAPSEQVFWSAVVLLVLALIGHFSPGTPFLSLYQFWIAIAAAAILIIDCVFPAQTAQVKKKRR
jgi:hypothetical protein